MIALAERLDIREVAALGRRDFLVVAPLTGTSAPHISRHSPSSRRSRDPWRYKVARYRQAAAQPRRWIPRWADVTRTTQRRLRAEQSGLRVISRVHSRPGPAARSSAVSPAPETGRPGAAVRARWPVPGRPAAWPWRGGAYGKASAAATRRAMPTRPFNCGTASVALCRIAATVRAASPVDVAIAQSDICGCEAMILAAAARRSARDSGKPCMTFASTARRKASAALPSKNSTSTVSRPFSMAAVGRCDPSITRVVLRSTRIEVAGLGFGDADPPGCRGSRPGGSAGGVGAQQRAAQEPAVGGGGADHSNAWSR